MKIAPVSLLLAVLTGNAFACPGFDLTTECADDEGRPCRQIPQLRKDKCGIEQIVIKARWCNNTRKPIKVTSDSILKLTGGAASSLNDGNAVIRAVRPVGQLAPGQCEDAEWMIDINNCRQFFNYEVNIKTDDPNCRSYFFARQMKTHCKVSGAVDCTVPDGTACDDFEGPKIKVIEEPGCPPITCIDQTPESCRQDVKYDFTLINREDQLAKFDLSPPQVAYSKVAWKLVPDNNANFSPLPGNTRNTWQKVQTGVNTCRVIPSGAINIRGNIINAKTGKNDPDYGFCFNFNSQLKRNFDGENGKLPFCQDIGLFGPPPVGDTSDSGSSKGKGKGKDKGKGKGKGSGPPPPTPCPGINPASPSAPRDEL